MTKSKKITLSASRDIPFNKLVLSQANVRRVKAGVSIEELAEDIARRTLLASLTVRPVLDEDGEETGMFEVPAGGRRYRALELLVKKRRLNHTAPVPCIVGTEGLADEDRRPHSPQRLEGCSAQEHAHPTLHAARKRPPPVGHMMVWRGIASSPPASPRAMAMVRLRSVNPQMPVRMKPSRSWAAIAAASSTSTLASISWNPRTRACSTSVAKRVTTECSSSAPAPRKISFSITASLPDRQR